MKKAVLICAIAMLGGCAAGTVRTRAAFDLKCPEEQVAVSGLGGNSFAARGCGKRAAYVIRTEGFVTTAILNSEIQSDADSPKPAAVPAVDKK